MIHLRFVSLCLNPVDKYLKSIENEIKDLEISKDKTIEIKAIAETLADIELTIIILKKEIYHSIDIESVSKITSEFSDLIFDENSHNSSIRLKHHEFSIKLNNILYLYAIKKELSLLDRIKNNKSV